MQVTVLGAGPAGASAAIALAQAGLTPRLVDPYDHAVRPLGEGLPAAGGAHLRSLGVWDPFRADGHLPCSGFLSCWGRADPDYRPALLDARGPSWQLDRARFDRMLRTAATAATGAIARWRLTAAHRQQRGWVLRFADGASVREVCTDFVVDATGRRRAFARLAGVRQRTDDSLICVAGLVADPDPDNATTIVETTEHGWWYTSRIPGGTAVAALFTDAAQAGRLRATDPPGWRALAGLTGVVRARLGGPDLQLVAPLRTTVAGSSCLARCGGPGWLAVGDAACAHDPLSSRGLHDAMAGGIDAAECIVRALDGDPDAPLRWSAWSAGAYGRYRQELAWFYRQEGRFRTAPFWRSRATR